MSLSLEVALSASECTGSTGAEQDLKIRPRWNGAATLVLLVLLLSDALLPEATLAPKHRPRAVRGGVVGPAAGWDLRGGGMGMSGGLQGAAAACLSKPAEYSFSASDADSDTCKEVIPHTSLACGTG